MFQPRKAVLYFNFRKDAVSVLRTGWHKYTATVYKRIFDCIWYKRDNYIVSCWRKVYVKLVSGITDVTNDYILESIDINNNNVSKVYDYMSDGSIFQRQRLMIGIMVHILMNREICILFH